MIADLDRDVIARGRRQAQALEALEFERQRETALVEQVELLVLEAEGPRIDAEAFARLDPADVVLVREVLVDELPAVEDEEDAFAEEDGYVELGNAEAADDAGVDEDEIARLQREIDASRALQGALERYVAALEQGPG